MGNFPNITHLIIASENFTQLPALNVKLEKLKKLDASHNKITELNKSLSFFKHTPNIGGVDLSSNNLTNLDYHVISQLQNLASLNLSDNQIITIDMSINIKNSIQYAHFDKLLNFDISHNRLTSADKVIEMIGTNLVILNISSNPIRKIDTLAFSKFGDLKELNLRHTNLTESNFNATKIEIFDESNNSIVLNGSMEYDLHPNNNQVVDICMIYKNLSNIERVFISNELQNKSKDQCKSGTTKLEEVEEEKLEEIPSIVVFGMILALIVFVILAFIAIKSDRKEKMRRQGNLSVIYRNDARDTVVSLVGLDDDKQLLMESYN